jgi:dihydrofolate reductase
MRQLVVNTFLTVDGVMQAPGGPGERWDGGVDHGGWSTGYWDDQISGIMAEITGRPFELLLGRKTYAIFAAHWPRTDQPGADLFNNATKHVASRTLDHVDWQNSILIKGDVADYVRNLKQTDGPQIQVHGSGTLLQTLLEHDLVDAFSLLIFPLVLGSGKRLFGAGTVPAGLKTVDVKMSSTGVIAVRYARAGDLRYGSFAVQEATAVRKQLAEEEG